MLKRAADWAGYGDLKVNALDVGRGIAILAVIYGHALAPWFMSAGEHFSHAAFLQWKFGAAFMMAFFFFLSGAGWRDHKSLRTTFRQALALVLIAWLASAAFDAVRLTVSLAGLAPAVGAEPLDPIAFFRGLARMAVYGDAYSLSALWFLVALAVVRVIAALLVRLGPLATVLGAALVVTVTLTSTELGWRNYYQLHLLGVALSCFLGGRAARAALAALHRTPAAAYALLIVAGGLLVSTFHLNEGCRWDFAGDCGVEWLSGHFGVSMIIGQFGNLPLFAVSAIAGIGFATGLSILLARYGGRLGAKLDGWGRNSLNLLVVNCLFLHVGNVWIAQWIVPEVPGEGAPFFVLLFGVTVAANLWLTDALARPLRRLFSFASTWARRMLDLAMAVMNWAAVALRADRVSQRYD